MKQKGMKGGHDRPSAKRENDLERELSVIYRDEQGKMPDLTKLDQQRSRWGIAVIAAIAGAVAILVGIAWLGFSLRNPFGMPRAQDLLLHVEGPERVSLGEEVTYFVNYQNFGPSPLTQVRIRVTFPSDFTMTESQPVLQPGEMEWQVGSISVEGRGTIRIRGIFMGALGTVTAVQVVGTYERTPGSAAADALATKTLRYEQSVLDGRLEVPASVLPGDRVVFTYRVINRGQRPISGMLARFHVPNGFQPELTTSTGGEKGIVELSIGTIAEGASTTVAVYGSFASGVSGEMQAVAEAGRVSPEGVFFANHRSAESFTVFAGDLSLKLVMNGSDSDAVVSYGDRLRFSVQYENTASEELKDVTIRFRVESSSGTTATSPALVDWSGYSDSASGTRRGNVVTWTDAQIPLLAALPAHEIGTIDIDLQALSASAATGTQVARITVEALIGSVGKTAVNRVIRAVPMTMAYLTDAALAVDARYYSEEGAPIGKGPLPPIVKQTTTYRIHWEITKRVHALETVKVTAQLPPIATWTGNTILSVGSMSYDNVTGVVTWTIPRLLETEDVAMADFDLAITPTEADADRFARVLGESRFEATDVNASRVVTQTRPALSTDLQNDETARGKGVVRKP